MNELFFFPDSANDFQGKGVGLQVRKAFSRKKKYSSGIFFRMAAAENHERS